MHDDGLCLAMTLIVRDEAEGIVGCLESWWSAFDYAVIVDTGSEDETKKVIQTYADEHPECKLILGDFEWMEHFGKARNRTLELLPDEVQFISWIDADDRLSDAHKLRELAAQLAPHIAGTIHKYDYARDGDGNCICELWRERLIRRSAVRGWELPIHEVLKVEGELVHVPEGTWIHQLTPERAERRDPRRNYKILSRDYEESRKRGEPPNTRTLAYLGTEALALGETEEAIDRFREYMRRGDTSWDEERCQVAHKLSMALRLEQDLEESASAAFLAIQERPDWADGYLDLAEIALNRGEPQRALHFCDTALKLEPPQTLLIINPLEYTYQPRLMRSVALAQLGRLEESWAETQTALAMTPQREDLVKQAATIQRQLQQVEAERHLLALREILVRFDENAKACRLMDCAPYIVQDRPAVAQARLDQREMTLHLTEPDTYRQYYSTNKTEASFEHAGIKVEDAHKAYYRVWFMREGLMEQAA